MPVSGELKVTQHNRFRHFRHEDEIAQPHYYKVTLDNRITAEMSPTERGVFMRFTYPEGKDAYVVLDLNKSHNKIKIIPEQRKVVGYTTHASQAVPQGYANYFVIVFDQPIEGYGTWTTDEGKIRPGVAEEEGFFVSGYLKFAPGGQVNARVVSSFISEEQAEKNLHRELKDYNIKALAEAGRRVWNETLGRIKVEGGTEDDKTVFYSSFYRTFERPICMSEDGRYFSAFDGKVHEDNGTPFYNDDWIWDTYRAAHPLRTLIDRQKEEDIIASYLRMAEQMGNMWMPTFPEVTGDTRRMNSNHAVATIADALAKGLKVDTVKAYEACRKGMEEKTLAPWSGAAAGWLDMFYHENGYIPALRTDEKENDPNVHPFEKRQPVAVTLGTSYDQWCLSRVAEALNKKEEAEYYLKCSYNYRNLYNKETAFFHPKDKEGHWIEPFDYRYPGGMGAREYYGENNGWVYRWDVPHNVADLISLMGGKEQFIANLDRTFTEPLGRSKYEFYAKLPDHTGNVGQFSMANEPSLHVPYLYNYAGQPWKTQKRIRQMLKTWFRNDLMGIPGDEDGGGMTSFVVFSSLGFYPVTPGLPVYNIGSPLFTNAKVTLSNGAVFEIEAQNTSADNKYIQSATLNGKEWNKSWFSHEDLKDGGKLVLVMGSKPNKAWGSGAGDVPPSLEMK
jgi:predicted alpha-1,2-mannosidase